MGYTEELLQEVIAFLDREKQRCSKMLKGVPEGNLICETGRGKRQYRWSVPDGKDASGIYRYNRKVITKNQTVLRGLARKEYARSAMCILEHNAKILDKALSNLRDYSPESVQAGMRSAYQTLPEEMFQSLKPYAKAGQALQEWASEKYEKSQRMVEKRIHTTTRGLKVRSRAELAIAELLYRYEIPFRYEQVLWLRGREFAPDFTFLGYDGREFYWEFCGMMKDPGYVSRHLRRREAYERDGITEWNDMIYSYSDEDSLDLRVIDAVIRMQILPRVYPDRSEKG